MLLYPCQGNYGFAEFDDLRDAQDAVKDLDGCKLLGTRIRVEHSRESKYSDRGRRRSPGRRKGNPPGKRTGYKLLVENLSSRTSWQDLKDYMRQAGDIMYTNCHDRRSGEVSRTGNILTAFTSNLLSELLIL